MSERQERRELIAELRQRKDNDETDLIIRNNKIMNKTKSQLF